MSADLTLVPGGFGGMADLGGAVAGAFTSEDLMAISTDVWTCFLGEDVRPLFEEPTQGAEVLLASVGITGAWGGHVLLELSPEGAEQAAKAMLGLDEVTFCDVTDAVGELSNMVGGNVKSLLPAPSHLGLPIVVRGAVSHTPGTDTVEVCRADLGWADLTLRVSVWARTTNPEG